MPKKKRAKKIIVRKILLTLFFLVLTVLALFFGVRIFTKNTVTTEDTTQLPAQEPFDVDFARATPAPLNERVITSSVKQAGWIPAWAFEAGFASFRARASYFDSISPVWYEMDEQGLIQPNRIGMDRVKQFIAGKNIKLIPSVASFGADVLHEIFNDSAKLEAHIAYLKSEVETYGYDGIDIDYESMYAEDKAEFIYLIRSLYEYLNPLGKKLSVAVMPTWTNADIYRGLRQTREVQDLHQLGLYAHEIRIMTYNLTNYNSLNPGPVSPLDWQEASLRHIVTKVDRSKLFLGISQYGYDGWSENPIMPEPYMSLFVNDVSEKGQADAVTFKQVGERARYKTSEGVSASGQEQYMTYVYEGKTYVIYYPTAVTNRLRLDLAKKYNIAGATYWRLGDEDPNSYVY